MVVVTGTLNSCGYSTNLSASPVTGVALVGNGSSPPAFGTVLVVGGGTGQVSVTAYAPICGGTTSTGAFQSASTGISTSGFVLTSTGASSLPTWQAVSASGAVTSVATDSGTATPSSGVITITAGTTGFATTGSGSTVTLSGFAAVPGGGTGRNTLTAHAILVGNGVTSVSLIGPSSTSGQILQSAGASADPAFSTATYPSTTTANQILYSSATNTVGGLSSANSAVLVTNSSGVPAFSSTMTNGQVIIGSTSATPTAATLTAGSGVTITNGAGSITIASSTSGMTWSTVTTNTSMAVNNGYVTNSVSQLQMTLPTTAAVGEKIVVKGATSGGWIIKQNASQQIIVSNSSFTTSGTGGSVAANGGLDSISITCIVANNIWSVDSVNSQGVTVV